MLPMQNIFNAFFFTHSIDIAEAECCRHDFGGYYQLFFIHSFPLTLSIHSRNSGRQSLVNVRREKRSKLKNIEVMELKIYSLNL